MDVITTHITADFDALASMIAAKKLYPDAVLAFPGSQEKGIRDFMLMSTAYAFDIEKASRIDINKITRLILVDIRQKSRIGKFAEVVDSAGVEVHIYDHHPTSRDDIRGRIEVIRPYGSTTTIFCSLFKERSIDISPDEATAMMLGIYEDTGNLTFSSTTLDDFYAAAYLLSKGANLNIVSDFVIKDLSVEQVGMLNELIESSCTYTAQGVDILIAKASSDTYIADFAVLVHKLKNMSNVDALTALARMEDRIYLIVRSRIQEVNAGEIAAAFGGGGHATAASATIHDVTMIQAEQRLTEVLDTCVRPVKTAGDFMAAPVKTIGTDKTLDQASELLTRYNINVLPVVENKKLAGLISRQIIEKARHHGLVGIPVREYMNTEYDCVNEQDGLMKIKNIVINNNQRFVPVMRGSKVTGAITRTDLLRVLHADIEPENPVPELNHSAHQKRIKSLIHERLSDDIIDLLEQAGAAADDMGCNVYAVGGFVRDIFLRRRNLDIDLVVEGDGIAYARMFAEKYGYSCKIFKKFGTAVVSAAEGQKVDIASARLEYYERPAALPKVEWSSLKLDLYRRDFTINTLALHLNKAYFGEIIDFFGARRDIKEKTLRVLHNLSFVEDPSRIFRAVRFEQRYGLHISKFTNNLINNAVKHGFVQSMSGKRIFSELELLLKETNASNIVKRLHELKILQAVHPDLKYEARMKAMLRTTDTILSWYDLLYLDKGIDRWFVYFLVLFDGLANELIEDSIKKFDLKKKHAASFRIAKKSGFSVLYTCNRKKNPRNSEIYHLLHDLPTEVCLYLMAKTGSSSTRKIISHYFTHLANKKVHVTGNDLKKIGIPTGKIYRKILDALLDAVLDNEIEGRREELNYIKSIYQKETA